MRYQTALRPAASALEYTGANRQRQADDNEPLAKSRVKSEFNGVNADDKVEAQTEAFMTATVASREDTPYLKRADDALDMETKTGKRAVGAFFLAGQRMMLGCFSGEKLWARSSFRPR